MNNGQEVRKLTKLIRRLQDDKVTEKISTAGSGELHAAYAALEDLRLTILEKNTLLSSSDERTQRQIAAVTHDMKMYLALISGYAESMQDGMDDRDYLSLIREKCMEMNDIVMKIIDDAGASAEQLKSRIRLVKLRDFLPSVLGRALEPAFKKHISVSVSRIPNVRIAIYESDFISVLFNVISNAIKYTPENGSIRITILTSTKNLIINVIDSGPGVKPEDVPLIFERYYTGDKARKSGGGTGVGLANAKEIMLRHGGDIRYIERKRHGARFLIYLPKYSKLRDVLTPMEYNLTLSVLSTVFFPVTMLISFVNIFITSVWVFRENRVVARHKRIERSKHRRARLALNKKSK